MKIIALLSLIALLASCVEKRNDSVYYFKMSGDLLEERFYSITKLRDSANCQIQLYTDNLDSAFNKINPENPYSKEIKFCKENDLINYRSITYQNDTLQGNCIEFKTIDFPTIYQTCLLRVIKDTVFNNTLIKQCNVYQVSNKDRYTPDDYPKTIFLDVERSIIVKWYTTNHRGDIITHQELLVKALE